MRFDVSSTALLSRLQLVSKVIASKNSLPILDDFLFQVVNNKLIITASDSEVQMRTSLELMNVEGEGIFAVAAKMLLDPLKELPEQPLSFDINDDNLEIFISYQNGKYHLIGESGEAYPAVHKLGDDVMSLSIDADVLLKGINSSLFAAGDDELRPVMNGIYMDILPENLTFVASDGHKLVRYTNTSIQPDFRGSFILPKKPASLLKTVLGKEKGEVKLEFDDKSAYFTGTDFKMCCRLIEGRYPNYNVAIPKENPFKVTLDRLSFLTALKRVSVFANSTTELIKLNLSSDTLDLSGQDADFSTSAEERMACEYVGEPMSIGFKASFLIEMLQNISAPEVVVELADKTRPGIMLPSENEEEEDLLMLLMPMMLND